MNTSRVIDDVFDNHNVDAHVTEVTDGPIMARYAIALGSATTAESVLRLRRTLAVCLGTDALTWVTPIPGTNLIGLDVPHTEREPIPVRVPPKGAHPLTLPLGLDMLNGERWITLSDLPHMLVAGTTGGGKSTFLRGAIDTLITRNAPAAMRLVLVDPKRVEFTVYEDVPHLYCPVVKDARTAMAVFETLVRIMDKRYRVMELTGTNTITDHNTELLAQPRKDMEPLPYVVVVVDELADLMMVAGKMIERSIVRLGQLSRAAGIHLVLATQRPSVDVVTGMIKTNIPARLAFKVAAMPDSRVILDRTGAQHLLGNGDSLYGSPDTTELLRTQTYYASLDDARRDASLATWAWGHAPQPKAPAPKPQPVPKVTPAPAWVAEVSRAQPPRPVPRPVPVVTPVAEDSAYTISGVIPLGPPARPRRPFWRKK